MSINPRLHNTITSYKYNNDGYLSEKTKNGTTTYSYGTLGELKEVVTPTQTISYKQNANNQRVAKLINGEIVEKYLWANLTTLLAIYDKDDNLVQRFEYADQRMPISMTQNAQKYYLHYDQIGTLKAVSDSSLNVVKEISYDAYGNILSETNEAFKVPFGFAGGLYDADTKLTRFGYRDYDAYTGKWTAKDPIGFAGGDSNLYGYVLGDPVNLIDPTGKIAWVPIILIGSGLYLLYDTINDGGEFIATSADNINQNNWSEPLTPESYLANYEQIERERRERVRSQLDASCDIGQEVTGDILTRGIPFGQRTGTGVGVIYEEAH